MTTGTHLHNPLSSIDDSVFWANAIDSDGADYLQVPPVDLSASLAKPAPVLAPVLTDVLYLTESGTTSPISVSDINQGQLGDCFLLSPIGEEALFHPSSITNMIHANTNGTETVTLYIDSNGRLPTFSTKSFKAVEVTVNNSFSTASVDNGAQQDVAGNLKEIWPQVLEKAVATLDGGYNAIANGGYPVLAMEELTGQAATWTSPASLTFATLQKYIAAGDLITMDTGSGGAGYGLVGDHCYMFEKLNGSGSTATVQLGNPWGFDQPASIPLSQLAHSGIVQIDIGHTG